MISTDSFTYIMNSKPVYSHNKRMFIISGFIISDPDCNYKLTVAYL